MITGAKKLRASKAHITLGCVLCVCSLYNREALTVSEANKVSANGATKTVRLTSLSSSFQCPSLHSRSHIAMMMKPDISGRWPVCALREQKEIGNLFARR